MFAYCNNNPAVLVDSTGTCPYENNSADFIRLEHNLPPIKCTCVSNSLAQKTTIDETENSIRIEINISMNGELADMSLYELSRYVDFINQRLYNEYKINMTTAEKNNYLAELRLHIEGWDVAFEHPWKENCEVAQIDIVNGKVRDNRWWVNEGARILYGGQYIEYEKNFNHFAYYDDFGIF